MTEKYEPPKSGVSDVAYTLARAGISSIPLVGSAAVELFAALLVPPLEKRRQAWMEQIAEGLRTLEENQDIKLDDLKENDAFIDTVMQASQSALRNSQKEKLEALRNAVLNSALPSAPDQSLQQMFLSFVDTFTVWHIKLLKLFNEPGQWFESQGYPPPELFAGALSNVVEAAFPELKGQRAFYDQVWNDLYVRGLVNTERLHGMMTGAGLLASRTSDIGKRFIKFIESPI